jgi:hypothetical protein
MSRCALKAVGSIDTENSALRAQPGALLPIFDGSWINRLRSISIRPKRGKKFPTLGIFSHAGHRFIHR